MSDFLRENDIGIHLDIDVEIEENHSYLVDKKEIEAAATEIFNDFKYDQSFVAIILYDRSMNEKHILLIDDDTMESMDIWVVKSIDE